jgi:hypothetical protein
VLVSIAACAGAEPIPELERAVVIACLSVPTPDTDGQRPLGLLYRW